MLRVEAVPPFVGAPPLTFEVGPGRCTGLLGRSADVSHLLMAACALARPSGGRVMVEDLDTRTHAARARQRLAASLSDGCDRRLTVREYLTAVAEARAATGTPARCTVETLIDRLGLAGHHRLTGAATVAATALAAALLPTVSVLVLIDPFSQLDPDVRIRGIESVKELAKHSTAVLIGSAEERDVRAVSHAVIAVGASR